MLKFGLSNIRRLKNVEPIELKKITLLVGRNSAGKSTFLRTLLLMRQSLLTRTSSPILWFGDLVDFGSLKAALTKQADEDVIYLKFQIDEIDINREFHPFVYMRFQEFKKISRFKNFKNISYKVGIEENGDRNKIKSILVNVDDPNLEYNIIFNKDNTVKSVSVNGFDISRLISNDKIIVEENEIFPEVNYIADESEGDIRLWGQPHFYNQLIRELMPCMDNRASKRSFADVAFALFMRGEFSAVALNDIANSMKGVVKKSLRDMAKHIDNPSYRMISNILMAEMLPTLFRGLSGHLTDIFTETLYMGPARVRSERYYRYQDLAVSEIDPDGKNFPMFLNSLTAEQVKSFSDWVENLFGYGVKVSRSTGHISIDLEENSQRTNIVDVGYGVSQILPVLGQIWWGNVRAITKGDAKHITLLAIEQPELHLHPAHQSLLADALVWRAVEGLADYNSINKMHYIVETHSETLVNRLGGLISSGHINSSDVQIILFEPSVCDPGITEVRTVNFDDAGALIDWPYGFFEAAVYS